MLSFDEPGIGLMLLVSVFQILFGFLVLTFLEVKNVINLRLLFENLIPKNEIMNLKVNKNLIVFI